MPNTDKSIPDKLARFNIALDVVEVVERLATLREKDLQEFSAKKLRIFTMSDLIHFLKYEASDEQKLVIMNKIIP